MTLSELSSKGSYSGVRRYLLQFRPRILALLVTRFWVGPAGRRRMESASFITRTLRTLTSPYRSCLTYWLAFLAKSRDSSPTAPNLST